MRYALAPGFYIWRRWRCVVTFAAKPVRTTTHIPDVEFRDMLVAIRDNVAGLKKQGKSLDEVIAANLPLLMTPSGVASSLMAHSSLV
jgi:hypothetical protein